jgi:hypothetical protein
MQESKTAIQSDFTDSTNSTALEPLSHISIFVMPDLRIDITNSVSIIIVCYIIMVNIVW